MTTKATAATATSTGKFLQRAFRCVECPTRPFFVRAVKGRTAELVDTDGVVSKLPLSILADGLKHGLLEETVPTWNLLKWRA